MALINVPDIQNLDPATPELFNSRFGTIADEINGNLDAANLEDAAVTAPKLAPDAVTTAKIVDAAVTPPKFVQPYKFSVYRNASWTSANSTYGKVLFDTEEYDSNGNYDPTTNHRWTAPVNGFYTFRATVSFVLAAGALGQVSLYKNGTIAKRGNQVVAGAASVNFGGIVTADMQLLADDYIEIFGYGSGGAGGVADATHFSGHLISQT